MIERPAWASRMALSSAGNGAFFGTNTNPPASRAAPTRPASELPDSTTTRQPASHRGPTSRTPSMRLPSDHAQVEVEHDQPGRDTTGVLEHGRRGADREERRVLTLGAQVEGEGGPHQLVVVDDQDRGAGGPGHRSVLPLRDMLTP